MKGYIKSFVIGLCVCGCFHPCVAEYCADYDIQNCPGYNDGVRTRKCKLIEENCDGSSSCSRYRACFTVDGTTWEYAYPQESCHLENNNKCYPNARDCKKFGVNVTGASGAWTCKQEYQTGTAIWNDAGGGNTSWDVGACGCNNTSLNVPGDGCSVGVVNHDRSQNFIESGTSKINYVQTRRYCRECAAGKVPTVGSAAANYSGVSVAHYPQNGNGNWGVWKCSAAVEAPYYATGCEINFNLSSGAAVVSSCRSMCSNGLTITTNGATSASACTPDETEYTDSTGTFTLGADKCN